MAKQGKAHGSGSQKVLERLDGQGMLKIPERGASHSFIHSFGKYLLRTY